MRTLWAIADLHLPLATPAKDMGALNPLWRDYVMRIQANWTQMVGAQDVVILAGDISWAMRFERALIDLAWLHQLPGTKILMRGNHDFWWPSAVKLAKSLPPSCIALTSKAVQIGSLALAGTRLWSDDECVIENIFFKSEYRPPVESARALKERQRLVLRELDRLQLSLSTFPKQGVTKVAVTHFPPIGTSLAPTRASSHMEHYGVQVAIFGHLHNVPPDLAPFGRARGIDFILCSADHLNFTPKKILCF